MTPSYSDYSDAPIAIVSMGCVFPGAFNCADFWSMLMHPDPSLQRLPPADRWDPRRFHSEDRQAPDKGYSALGGYIDGFHFDRARFPQLDGLDLCPLETWLATAMRECLDGLRAPIPQRVRLLLGATAAVDPIGEALLPKELLCDFEKLMPSTSHAQSAALLEALRASLGLHEAGDQPLLHRRIQRLAARMLPADTSTTLIDAACVSSLYALELGRRALAEGQVDLVLCGGVFMWGPVGQVLFSKLGGLSSRGCFPLDAGADGTLFGDGAALVAVKRVADAERDGDQILALVPGIGISSDGKGKAVYAPNSRGQVLALQRAYNDSGVCPRTIQYLEAHATGTPVGDATELAALLQFFAPLGLPPASIALGSVKGLFGHLGWVAGTASLIKLLLALRHRTLPPQPGYSIGSAAIPLTSSPFAISTIAASWPEGCAGQPRRAALSGFGFGGTNAHVILEEYRQHSPRSASPERDPSVPVDPIALVALGCLFPEARSSAAALAFLAAGRTAQTLTFGPDYAVNLLKYRLLPRTAKVTDRAQLLLLEATGQALAKLTSQLPALRSATEVYISHLGPLAQSNPHAKRIYWDGIRTHLLAAQQTIPGIDMPQMLGQWETQIRAHIPPPNEDSFPGIMPSLLAGRLSNYFDLQGLNLCVNGGCESFASALELGMQALRLGRAKLAIVGAASVGSLLSAPARFAPLDGPQSAPPFGEGAAVFCLMRKSDAQAAQLPIIRVLSERELHGAALHQSAQPFGNLLGANGAVGLLRKIASPVETKLRRVVSELRPRAQFASEPLLHPGERSLVLYTHEDPARLEQQIAAQPLPQRIIFVVELAPFQSAPLTPAIERAWWTCFGTLRRFITHLEKVGGLAAVLLISGCSPSGVRHPAAGLFTGLLRSLKMEAPTVCFKVLLPPAEADANLKNLKIDRKDPEVEIVHCAPHAPYQVNHFFIREPLPGPAPLISLDEKSVVLAVGGGRGITAELVDELLLRYRCTVIILGRTQLQLDSEAPAILALQDFIREERERDPSASVRVLRGRHDALLAERALREQIQHMRTRGGQIDYRTCDVSDPDLVQRTIKQILDCHGRLDLVLFGAGLPGSLMGHALTRDDSAAAHVAVKAKGLLHVIQALPKLFAGWLVVMGSMSSQGSDGMGAYAAANEFANVLAAQAKLGPPAMHLRCLNWPAWRDAGTVARDPALLAKLERDRAFSLMTAQEGRALFLAELAIPEPSGVVYFMGATELARGRERGVFIEPAPSQQRHYLDKIVAQSAHELIAEHTLERDRYLHHHLVGGDPVVPGTFLLEAAAEAALALASLDPAPDWKVAAIEDATFHRFIKLHGSRPLRLRIAAKALAESANRNDERQLAVTISSEVVSPRGIVLQQARMHLSARIVLRRQLAPAPQAGQMLVDESEVATVDPYCAPGGPLQLSALFDNMLEPRSGASLCRAYYEAKLHNDTELLEGFVLPCVLLDSLLRTAALRPSGAPMPVFVPLRIGRISFYTAKNDCQLRADYSQLEIRHRSDGECEGGVCEALAPDGRILLAARGLASQLMGHVQPPTLPYIDRITTQTLSALTAERELCLERDPYLRTAAQLEGVSVLPGSFLIEIASEAALLLRPGNQIQRIESIEFCSVLKLFPGRGVRLQIRARLLASEHPGASRRVAVALISQVQRGALTLVSERVHATMEVVLGQTLETPGEPLAWDEQTAVDEPHIPGVLYLPQSPLRLGAYFTAVGETRRSGRSLRSRYRNPAAVNCEPFRSHQQAPLLIDGVLQSALERRGPLVAVGVPRSIRCIRFFQQQNDAQIRERYEHINVLTELASERDGARTIQAFTPSGQQLLEVSDFRCTRLGYVDTRSAQVVRLKKG